jgi:predicted outer membrane protein
MKTTSINYLATTKLALCATLLFATNGISADKDTLNAADVEFVKNEAAANRAVVKLAGLGVQKAVRADVKAFAEILVTDHTKADEEMTKLAATKGVELSAVIAPKHAEIFQDLEKAENANFDKEFLAVIESGHEKCVSNFKEASVDAKDNDLRQWATNMQPVLASHLAKARELSSGSTTSQAKERNAAISEAAAADNTKLNMRDRNAATLTPIDQGNSDSDVGTTARIRKEIIAKDNMSVNAQNVKIITNSGKVTLRGPVNTAAEKRLIGEIAERIARAENVDNQLEIKATTPSN